MTATTTYGNYIGGEWRPAATGKTFENRSPANTDDLIGHFAASGAEDVDAAVTAAAEAADGWRRTSPIARANILFKAAEILASRTESIGRELTREEGKTLKEGIGETGRAVQILRYFAGEAQQPHWRALPLGQPTHAALHLAGSAGGRRARSPPGTSRSRFRPGKPHPALAFGNTVVFKPASYTPLCAVRLTEALADAGLPAGVLNLVTGSAGAVGDPLVKDERVVGDLVHWLESGREPNCACWRPSAVRSSNWNWAAKTRRSCWRTPISSTL